MQMNLLHWNLPNIQTFVIYILITWYEILIKPIRWYLKCTETLIGFHIISSWQRSDWISAQGTFLNSLSLSQPSNRERKVFSPPNKLIDVDLEVPSSKAAPGLCPLWPDVKGKKQKNILNHVFLHSSSSTRAESSNITIGHNEITIQRSGAFIY